MTLPRRLRELERRLVPRELPTFTMLALGEVPAPGERVFTIRLGDLDLPDNRGDGDAVQGADPDGKGQRVPVIAMQGREPLQIPGRPAIWVLRDPRS